MEQSTGTVRTACDIQIDGRQGAESPGREAQANMEETEGERLP